MFQTLLVAPLYNSFIYLIGVIPGGDVGIAIIVLTLIIRAVFYPAFAASIRTQMGMQAVQDDLAEINKKYKDNSTERAAATMALYRERNIRPFSGFLALFVQIPIFLALYFAFFREGLPNIDVNLLYSFVPVPPTVNIDFFGIINLLSKHNIVIAGVVGSLQYLVVHFSLTRSPLPTSVSDEKRLAGRAQQRLMLYFLPGLMTIVTYSLPAAVGFYFATGNVVSLGQEWLIRKQLAKKASGSK